MTDLCLEVLAEYVGGRSISYFDVIGALDDAQCRLTEKLIREHPEVIPDISTLMAR